MRDMNGRFPARRTHNLMGTGCLLNPGWSTIGRQGDEHHSANAGKASWNRVV